MSGKTFDLSSITTSIASVPAADSTADVYTRDVVGDKSDTTATTGQAANTTFSLMRYIKGLWEGVRSRAADLDFLHDASVISSPVANSIGDLLNTLITRLTSARAGFLDTLNLDDKFLMSNAISGQVANSIADRVQALGALNSEFAGIAPSTNTVQNSLGTYAQVVASTAHTVIGLLISACANATVVNGAIRVAISVGGAGSEVVKMNFVFPNNQTSSLGSFFIPMPPSLIGKAVRVAIATANLTNATQIGVDIGVTLLELND